MKADNKRRRGEGKCVVQNDVAAAAAVVVVVVVVVVVLSPETGRQGSTRGKVTQIIVELPNRVNTGA